jgi:hypothetical protein
MTSKLRGLCGLLLVCAVVPALSATIFSDNFSDTTKTKINWITLANGMTQKINQGALTLTNPDSLYTGFLIHNFATKPSKFTLSAKFTITSTAGNGAGLMYCLNSTSGVKGYTLQLGVGQNMYVYKYAAAATQIIPGKSNSFINTTTNVISVSKSADTFNIYCNGHYVTRFNDAAFPSGDIAILVPPKATITVDDVVMTDDVIATPPSTCYADSFTSTDLEGWNTTPMMGSVTVGNGQAIFDNTDNLYASIVYTDGLYQTASMKGVVTHKKGAGMYGLTWVSVIAGDSGKVIYKSYAFLIDSLRRYSIVYPDSASVRTRPPQSFIFGALGTDTLEVVQYKTHFSFRVNSIDVGETIPIPATYRIDGAGLYIANNTSAAYSYFVVGGDSTGARCATLVALQNNRILPMSFTAPGAQTAVYDVLGRKLYKGFANMGKGYGVAPGVYIMRPSSQSMAKRRVVTVVK